MNHTGKHHIGFLLLANLLCAVTAFGQFESTDTTAAKPTPAADTLRRPLIQIPFVGSIERSPTYVITDSSINFYDYRYVGDLLATVPGVFIRDLGSPGQHHGITINGLDGRNIAYMSDGVLLNEPFTGVYDPYLYPTENIERVEIITGARAFFYGLNSNGMAVNFVSKSKKAIHASTRIRYQEATYGQGFVDGMFSQDIIRGLKERGVTVKVNTVLVPGVTLEGVAAVAAAVAELGADTMNAMPLYPVEGTPFGELLAPTAEEVSRARRAAEPFIAQMTHCQRCRADAVGMLDDEHDDDAVARLLAARSPGGRRPYVAVCTQEGYLVNQHLGGADRVVLYENADVDGRVTPRLDGTRGTPPAGGGGARWAHLAGLLTDCRALICSQLGEAPRMVLQGAGITVHEADGLVTDAVTDVFAGRPLRRARPPQDCATSCAGPGTGCG